MRYKKIVLLFCSILFLLVCNSDVYANEGQVVQETEYTMLEGEKEEKVLSELLEKGTTFFIALGGVGGGIAVITFVIKRQCNIEDCKIILDMEEPCQRTYCKRIENCTVLHNGRIIDQRRIPNIYNMELDIKIKKGEDREEIECIWIKELVLDMKEYEYVYIFKEKLFDKEECKVDENHCIISLKCPEFIELIEGKKFNIIEVFTMHPDNIKMKLVWKPKGWLHFLDRYNSTVIEFEKIQNMVDGLRIGITKSKHK